MYTWRKEISSWDYLIQYPSDYYPAFIRDMYRESQSRGYIKNREFNDTSCILSTDGAIRKLVQFFANA